MKKGFAVPIRALIGLLLLLSGTPAARAQTALGQPSLDEAKVQIWCATLRFVYEDTGHPQLRNGLRCEAGNLAALEASIRPDSQRVYSLLYQPIEGRGIIYQGKKDNPAQLAALTRAIISRLRSSAARRKDPARLARLTALETALTTYVSSGTPPGELAAAAAPTPPDTTNAAPPAAGLAEAAEAAAPAEARRPAPTPPDAAGSLMSRLFAPLALTLSLLSLVLFGLLRASVSRLLRRQQQEVTAAAAAAQQAQLAADQATRATAEAAASAAAAAATGAQIAGGASAAARAASELPLALGQLTAGQRAEVEALIQQRVAAELARRLPAAPGPGPAPTTTEANG
ncbi:hypothetical protein [uncultured Hymenobacter sp.]|uniref:hypothetical protein n=1 Tax=uncultured Hymenobacter sp. TaxID=170016 RepID=UPI0035C96F58